MLDIKFNLDLIYGPNFKIKNKYGFEPGREISAYIDVFAKNIGCDDIIVQTINNKVLNYAKKLSMTNSIIEAAIAKEHQFMGTQLRDAVALIFDDEIELLSYTEAAILFGRSALDIAAYVFALFTLEPFRVHRIDSFNSFSK